MIRQAVSGAVLLVAMAACGDERPEPVARIDVTDVRSEQARQRRAAPIARLTSAEQPGRLIYDPPPDLARHPAADSTASPVATPDSARRSPRPR